MSMTGTIERVEVIRSVQRRRRWSAEEKAAIVQETYAPGMSVSLVARRHGVAPNQLFRWRRLYAEGALSAVGAGEEVVPASEYRALAEPGARAAAAVGQKDPGKRDPARSARSGAAKKTVVALALTRAGRHAMKRIAETLGIARQTWPSRQSPHPAGGAVARHNRTRNCWPRSKRSLPACRLTAIAGFMP